MRDTKALKLARDMEPDPYRRRFAVPKWNRTITVADDHRLFSRLPEFSGCSKDEHRDRAESLAKEATRYHHDWRRLADSAMLRFGDGNGVPISGVVRDHFPSVVKDELRRLAHGSSHRFTIGFAHWRASGRTLTTWRRLVDSIG